MPFSRSTFVVSVFSTLALLAAACGDDTGGSGGSVGSGGNGSGGNPSTTSAGGAGGDPSTTSAGGAGGGGGGGSVCEETAESLAAMAFSLGCNSVDQEGFVAQCEEAGATYPECQAQIDAYFQCLGALTAIDWSCDEASNELTPNDLCYGEQVTVSECISG